MTWWRTSKGRTQALLAAFGVVALFGVLIGAFTVLGRGDQRVLVVTMAGQSEANRVTLKQDCGSLPGVSVVADRGAADRQAGFPVRFSLRGATPGEVSGLTDCVSRHPAIVRGYLTEGDGN